LGYVGSTIPSTLYVEEPSLRPSTLEVPALRPSLFKVPSLRPFTLEVPVPQHLILEVLALRCPTLEAPSLRPSTLKVPSLRPSTLEVPALHCPTLEVPALRCPTLGVPAPRPSTLEVTALQISMLEVSARRCAKLEVPSLRLPISEAFMFRLPILVVPAPTMLVVLARQSPTLDVPTQLALLIGSNSPLLSTIDYIFSKTSNPHVPGPLATVRPSTAVEAEAPAYPLYAIWRISPSHWTPDFITPGPSNPHDLGPSAAAAVHLSFLSLHFIFSVIAIYALNDFLCFPPTLSIVRSSVYL